MKRILITSIFLLTLSISVFPQAEYTSLELKFSGNEQIPTADLKEAVLACYGDNWKQQRENLVRYLDHFASKCSKDLLHSRGFWRSRMNGVWVDKESERLKVTISISEGLQYRIGKLSVMGANVISDVEILSRLSLRSGEVPDGVKLQELLYEELRQEYGERGYVQYSAEFEPDFIEPTEKNPIATVDIKIHVDEGQQFKVRRIAFEGVSDAVAKELGIFLKIGAGDIYVPRKMKESIDLINQEQRFRYIDHEQDVKVMVDDKSADVEIIVPIKSY